MFNGLLLAILLPSTTLADAASGAAVLLDRAMATADANLRLGQTKAAESHYGEALIEGWLLMGTLERLEGRLPEAQLAFQAASAGGDRRALHSLALVGIQRGEPKEAVRILENLANTRPKDPQTGRLLAQALMASGQAERAVKELEEARAAAPADLQLAFALAGAYLGEKKVDRAAGLFARIVEAQPIPQTHVLIGRAYRDAGEYARAVAELRTAVKKDAGVRHAHYELGMVALKDKGMVGLEEAISEFQAELKLAPEDLVANLELGVALVESQRPAEAVSALEVAARSKPASSRTLYYLGRAQLGAGRPAEALTVLSRALELAREQGGNTHALRGVHLQLGQALRTLGRKQEAETHFAEAASLSAQEAEEARDRFGRDPDSAVPGPASTPIPVIESSPLAELPMPERLALKGRVKVALTRAYLNLGVMQAQRGSFPQAADLFEKAAALDPDLPQVQSSLGVAYFNARRFDKAIAPLTRAVQANPADRELKRMLAMAWLNTEAYGKAVELLQDDPELGANPSLEFAYGLALVKTDRAEEAERIFSRLLSQHGDSAEVSVLLGQAHAQQGDFDAAVVALERALQLKADVAEANATLGVIYLRQGKLAEAEQALRAELKGHPTDVRSQQNLAVVLDAEQRGDEAVTLLRGIVQSRPDLSDARYLLGKILLAQGAATEAVEHLQTAARLAPGDANVHYQLGRAYQKLGRTELAEQEFERFRELKARR